MSLVLRSLFRSSPAVFSRSFHASSPTLKKNDESFARMKFKWAGFYKYGLLEDDFLTEFEADVEEAVRRLPEDLRLARIYRAIKAQQADLTHSILPEEEWSKFEDDHHYLQPYLEEVRREKAERAEWEATH